MKKVIKNNLLIVGAIAFYLVISAFTLLQGNQDIVTMSTGACFTCGSSGCTQTSESGMTICDSCNLTGAICGS